MNVHTGNDGDLEAMLRRIERHVLDDVWIGRGRARLTAATVSILAAAAVFGWADVRARAVAHTPGIVICSVALTLFSATALLSSVALRRSRFRWCTLAAYGGGLGTAVGLGVVWWHQTTPHAECRGPAAWMVAGVLSSVVLTALWLRAILTPLTRSQPDLRLSPESRAAGRPTLRRGPA